MTSFLLAFQFLTIIPLKIKEISEQRTADSLIYFPLVGLFLGLFLLGVNSLLAYLDFPYLASNIILVVSLIIITGGIHLDGLCDTADAFLSGKSKEEMLNLMRDPCAGTMGVLSLICIILLKIGLLSAINIPLRPNVLILICVLSRWSMVFSAFNFVYARKEGKAKAYMQKVNPGIFFQATAITLVVTFFCLYFKGLFILVIVAGITYLINRIISNKIGGLTGDTIGATSEINETLTLFFYLIIQ